MSPRLVKSDIGKMRYKCIKRESSTTALRTPRMSLHGGEQISSLDNQSADLPFNVGSIMERVIAANPQNGSKSDENGDSEAEQETSSASEPAAVGDPEKEVEASPAASEAPKAGEEVPAGQDAPVNQEKASTTSLTKELPGAGPSSSATIETLTWKLRSRPTLFLQLLQF